MTVVAPNSTSRVRDGAVAQPDHAVPGVQHARAPAHGVPLLAGFCDGARLAPQRAVDEEHRIAADDNTIRRHCRVEARDDLLGLGARECVGDVTRRGIGSLRGDDGVLVDAGDNDEGIDSGLAQHHSPAR